MRKPSDFTHEEYELMHVPLASEDVPADALAFLTAWISGDRLLVDDRPGEGIRFARIDSKAIAPLPHIFVSFYARCPYKRKAGHYPNWNGFYLVLYRDVEEGWKLVRLHKNTTEAESLAMDIARSRAILEMEKLLGNDLGDNEG